MIRCIAGLLLACAALGAHAQDADALFAATLPGMAGRPVALAGYRGQPLIVNFWARWCGPCRDEIPELRAVAQARRADGLTVLGIGLEDDQPNVRDFIKAYEMDYPVLFGRAGGIELMKALGNARAGLPFTLALDRRGKVVLHKLGKVSRAELEAAATAALK
ncbi:MAG: TlpA disulfide reductase family protein [Pseudomonadota bacterium]